MSQIINSDLSYLYKASDIASIWSSSQDIPIVNHPDLGKISPNKWRAKYHQKPCPFCGKKMVHGQDKYSTKSKQEAVDRGYQYKDDKGNLVINHIKNTYFHPNYVTLDHKLNKARFPELMFDWNNIQVICWQCNREKGDNNAFDIQHNSRYIRGLVKEALNRYPIL